MKTRKFPESFRDRLRSIMLKAWTLFKNGVVSLSLSLKLSWQLDKGYVNSGMLRKMLKK